MGPSRVTHLKTVVLKGDLGLLLFLLFRAASILQQDVVIELKEKKTGEPRHLRTCAHHPGGVSEI